jgi:hypothetical protein
MRRCRYARHARLRCNGPVDGVAASHRNTHASNDGNTDARRVDGAHADAKIDSDANGDLGANCNANAVHGGHAKWRRRLGDLCA